MVHSAHAALPTRRTLLTTKDGGASRALGMAEAASGFHGRQTTLSRSWQLVCAAINPQEGARSVTGVVGCQVKGCCNDLRGLTSALQRDRSCGAASELIHVPSLRYICQERSR